MAVSRDQVRRTAVALGDVLRDVQADPEAGEAEALAVKLCILAVGRHLLVGEDEVEVRRWVIASRLRSRHA